MIVSALFTFILTALFNSKISILLNLFLINTDNLRSR